MYRKAKEQVTVLDSGGWLVGDKQGRLARTWAPVFRARCLSIVDEGAFAPYYCADNGRPNVPVRLLIGLLILKEMWDLTDGDALAALDFDVRWQVALGVSMDEAPPCQKTLHNFRRLLMAHDEAKRLFAEQADALLAALEISPAQQRLDSTHILSNMARLTRLRLFCETLRVFLHALRRHAPALLATVPVGLRGRYLGEDGEERAFGDATREEARRRVAVSARDGWRLVEQFRGQELPGQVAAGYALVARLVEEQCVRLETPAAPAPGDADAAEEPVPVRLKPAAEIGGATLQSPHDPDATYGHKGKGYEVVVMETCGNGERPELITRLEVVPACAADQDQVAPMLSGLAARGAAPTTVVADTTFGASEVVLACAEQGVELVAPVSGYAPTPAPAGAPLREREFHLPWTAQDPPACCPLGVAAARVEPYTGPRGGHWTAIVFAAGACAECPARARCPVVLQADGTHVLRLPRREAVALARREAQTRPPFREKYRWRAGIEATHSELKRRHGLGRLRVRGEPPVEVAVFFKGMACNCKRAIGYWLAQGRRHCAAWHATLIFCVAAVLTSWPWRHRPRPSHSIGRYALCR